MYHIIIIIYGRSQLRRIDETIISHIEKQIFHVGHKFGAITYGSDPAYYRYTMPSGYNESSYAVLETASMINDILSKEEKKLYGYNIILLESSHAEFDEWKKYLCLTTQDNSLWIKSNIKDQFKEWVSYREDDDLLSLVTAYKEYDEGSTSLKDHFLYQIALEPFFYKILAATKKRAEKNINFYGPIGYGKHYSLEKVLTNYKAGALSTDYLWLRPSDGRYGPFEGFKMALDPKLLTIMIEKAEGEARDKIEQIKFLVMALSVSYKVNYIGDCLADDMNLLYSLYLTAYRLLFLAADLQPVIIVEEIEHFTAASKPLLFHIIEQCKLQSILIIYISQSKVENKYGVSYYLEATASNAISFVEDSSIDIPRLNRAKPYALMLYYSQAHDMRKEFYSEFSIHAVLSWFVQNLDDFSVESLYMITACDGMAPFEALLDHLSDNSLERISLLQRLKNFLNLGLVHNQKYPLIVFSDLSLILKERLGDRAILVYQKVALALYKSSNDNIYINTKFLFIILERSGFVDEALSVLNRNLQQDLNRRHTSLNAFFDRHYFSKHILSFNQQSHLNTILYNAKLRKKMLESCSSSVIISLVNQSPEHNDQTNPYAQFMELEKRRFYNASGHLDYPQYKIKEILYRFQKSNDYYGEALASIEMASSLFSLGQLRQAFDYCEINSRLCELLSFNYGICVNLSIEIASAFAFGNISLVLRSAEKGIIIATNCGMREKQLFFQFSKGRALFECGYYSDALRIFNQGLALATLSRQERCLAVFSSWVARCHSHLEQYDQAITIFSHHSSAENLYFWAECYYLMGNTLQATETIKSGQNHDDTDFYTLSEKENWQNGFDMIEGRMTNFYRNEALLTKLINTFAIFLGGLSYSKREALLYFDERYDFNKLTTDEPFSYLYSFYYSQLLDDDDDRELKSMTESRSGRLLNLRASRFDELTMQEDFLRKNYWNYLCGKAFRK